MSGLKISLLGGMEIGPAGGAGETAITRKAGVIIAYLALRDGRAQSREKLAGLLWSRNTDAQARTNLRQALSRLRKVLANDDDGPLIADGDRVGLDMTGVDLDVVRFEGLVAEGSAEALEEAAALYHGDLLEGLNLNEEAFEGWLRGERERLRVLAVGALAKLIAHCQTKPDLDRCVRAALRLLVLDPLQELAHRALMRAYSEQGRYTLALEQYEICRDVLQRELGVEPEAETNQQYQEILSHRANGNGSRQSEYAPLRDRPSIAVLPFENKSGDPEQDYFSDGLTQDIINALTRFRDLFVISTGSSFAVRDAIDNPGEAARRLGVVHVLVGSVRRAGGRVRVTTQLLDATDGRRLWGENYDRDFGEMFEVQDQITELIVATLIGQVEEFNLRRAERKSPDQMAAYDYLLRAKYAMESYTEMGGLLEARHLLEQATALDPALAAAWSAVAVSYVYEYESTWSTERERAIRLAEEFANKAMRLDELDARAHMALAAAHLYQFRHDLALHHIDRAIALNPYDYANMCQRAWVLVFAGRPDEGIAASKVSMLFNPLRSAGCRINAGIGEYGTQRFEEAVETLRDTASFGHMGETYRIASYAQLGRDDEARAMAQELEAELAPIVKKSDDGQEDWRSHWHSVFPYRLTEDFELLLDGLRKAGLPT